MLPLLYQHCLLQCCFLKGSQSLSNKTRQPFRWYMSWVQLLQLLLSLLVPQRLLPLPWMLRQAQLFLAIRRCLSTGSWCTLTTLTKKGRFRSWLLPKDSKLWGNKQLKYSMLWLTSPWVCGLVSFSCVCPLVKPPTLQASSTACWSLSITHFRCFTQSRWCSRL